MCFKCLGKGHIARGCYAKCQKCRGYHHHLICGVKIDSSKSEPVKSNSVKATQEPTANNSNGESSKSLATNLAGVFLSNISVNQETCTILQTAQVRVVGANGVLHMAKLLFDSGSSRTYISSRLVKKCKPIWNSSKPISYSVFGGNNSSSVKQCNLFDLKVLDCNGAPHKLTAVEIPVMCQPLVRTTVPVGILSKFPVPLADDYQSDSYMDIDILVGQDAYWKYLISDESVQVGGVVAQRS